MVRDDEVCAINNIVQKGYNPGDFHQKGTLVMHPGPQGADFPDHLFNTWLDYRESLGQSRADVIRELNRVLDRKYDNDRIYKWKKQKFTVAEAVMLQFVRPELPDVLRWFFNKYGYPIKGVDFEHLAAAISPSVKDLSIG